MFAAPDALEAFERYLTRRSVDRGTLTARQAIGTMVQFYRETEPSGLDPADGSDMLLFQWGTYDWGEGEHFELDITRQLIFADEEDDDAIWQLSLTIRFPPEEGLAALRHGDRWCSSKAELEEFEERVRDSAAFESVASRNDGDSILQFENAG